MRWCWLLAVIAVIYLGIPLASADGGQLEYGVQKTGSISVVGEVDTYSFSASSGDTVFIKVSKTNGDLWPRIELYGTEGRSLKKEYGSSDADITYTLTSAGRYNILVDDGTSWSQIGDYSLIVQRVNNPGNARPLSTGTSAAGSVDIVGDVDTYTFAARNGDTAILKASKAAGAIWPRIRLYSPTGMLLKSEYGSSDAQISMPLAADGTYVVLADDGTGWQQTGTYNVILQLLPGGGTVSSTQGAATATAASTTAGTPPASQPSQTTSSEFPWTYLVAAAVIVLVVAGAAVALRRRGGSPVRSPVFPEPAIVEQSASSVARKVVGFDVFVSYSSEDKPVADAVCSSLESRGIRCWIAPRDILPGTNYQESIIDAIDSSKIMILIFSSHSNTSPHVIREITRAIARGVVVIPFRIEDVAPSKSMEYLISVPHWLDAMTPPLEQHLEKLGHTVSILLEQWKDAQGTGPK